VSPVSPLRLRVPLSVALTLFPPSSSAAFPARPPSADPCSWFNGAELLMASQLRLGLPLTCLKGVGGISTRTRASRPDPLGYGAVNTWAHHAGRHNKPMKRWDIFIRRSWRCATHCDLRSASQSRTDKQPDICVLRAHANGTRKIYIEGKCLSPISTAGGRPTATRLAAEAASFQTRPIILADLDSRYATVNTCGIELAHFVEAQGPRALRCCCSAPRAHARCCTPRAAAGLVPPPPTR
jgi:hypothetical protein